MKTELLMSLERTMREWIASESENDALSSDVYYSEDLHVLMARAAAAVFDSSESGQKFAEDQ